MQVADQTYGRRRLWLREGRQKTRKGQIHTTLASDTAATQKDVIICAATAFIIITLRMRIW